MDGGNYKEDYEEEEDEEYREEDDVEEGEEEEEEEGEAEEEEEENFNEEVEVNEEDEDADVLSGSEEEEKVPKRPRKKPFQLDPAFDLSQNMTSYSPNPSFELSQNMTFYPDPIQNSFNLLNTQNGLSLPPLYNLSAQQNTLQNTQQINNSNFQLTPPPPFGIHSLNSNQQPYIHTPYQPLNMQPFVQQPNNVLPFNQHTAPLQSSFPSHLLNTNLNSNFNLGSSFNIQPANNTTDNLMAFNFGALGGGGGNGSANDNSIPLYNMPNTLLNLSDVPMPTTSSFELPISKPRSKFAKKVPMKKMRPAKKSNFYTGAPFDDADLIDDDECEGGIKRKSKAKLPSKVSPITFEIPKVKTPAPKKSTMKFQTYNPDEEDEDGNRDIIEEYSYKRKPLAKKVSAKVSPMPKSKAISKPKEEVELPIPKMKTPPKKKVIMKTSPILKEKAEKKNFSAKGMFTSGDHLHENSSIVAASSQIHTKSSKNRTKLDEEIDF